YVHEVGDQTNTRVLVDCRDATHRITVTIHSAGEVRFNINETLVATARVRAGNLSNGMYIVLARDLASSAGMRCFVNGVEASLTGGASSGGLPNAAMVIGSLIAGTNFWDGRLSLVKVWHADANYNYAA